MRLKANEMKETEQLRAFLEGAFNPFPDRDWSLLEPLAQLISIAKGKNVYASGKHCKHLYFLYEGAVRAYEMHNGSERSNYFFTEPSMFIDYHSIATKQISELCFVAEEDSRLLEIDYNELLLLYDQSPFLERVGRIMAERQFVIEFELRRMFLNMDALERYEYLIAKQPEIFRRFALKHIASFIGITPESLSRLKANSKLT